MATIVLHKDTEKKYILIGPGYETHNNSNYLEPFLGSLHINHHYGSHEMVSVCDKEGNISFLPKDELVVIEIDGVSPEKLII